MATPVEEPDQVRAELENTLRDLDLVVQRLYAVVDLIVPRLQQIARQNEEETR